MKERAPLGRPDWYGIPTGRPRQLPEQHSLLVVGATQSGKTSSVVIPAVLRWPGPLVVASVKRDIYDTTVGWRSHAGDVRVIEPGSRTGSTWNPLEGIYEAHQALSTARELTNAVSTRTGADGEFWNSLASRLLAGLFLRAKEERQSISDVVRQLDDRSFLDAYRLDIATSLLEPFYRQEARTLDSVVTTAQVALRPWLVSQPTCDVQPVVRGRHSLYLLGSRYDHVHHEGLFRGAVRSVIAAHDAAWREGSRARLLLVFDEAASVAALDDLDQLAATGQGLGIELVTVVQDFSQIRHRWGDVAGSLVNNHSTRMIFGGLSDPAASQFVPELEGINRGRPLRQWPRHSVAVVSGRDQPRIHRVHPWWRHGEFRRRVEGD